MSLLTGCTVASTISMLSRLDNKSRVNYYAILTVLLCWRTQSTRNAVEITSEDWYSTGIAAVVFMNLNSCEPCPPMDGGIYFLSPYLAILTSVMIYCYFSTFVITLARIVSDNSTKWPVSMLIITVELSQHMSMSQVCSELYRATPMNIESDSKNNITQYETNSNTILELVHACQQNCFCKQASNQWDMVTQTSTCSLPEKLAILMITDTV